jgi:maleylpyruvate isomerase
MTPPEDRARAWLEQQTAVLLDVADRLSDDDLAAPSALQGWTRTHLLAHVGFNAEALRRLLAWARTGVRTPMYPSRERRDAEIAGAGQWEAARARAFLRDSADVLAADLAALPPSALSRSW